MCGIAGIYQPGGKVRPEEILGMTRAIRHRGPDDEGYLLATVSTGEAVPWGGEDTPAGVYAAMFPFSPKAPLSQGESSAADLAFGHRRLSIIDLSPAGHQPMCDDEGRSWIVYNGEVYNYIEIRSELETLGHRFRTASDTEVILRAYREWGPACLGRLNGMWGLCIWDVPARKLFCARDRLGIKPFYYTLAGGRFAFASEIGALLELRLPREADDGLLWDFLRYGLVEHTAGSCFAGLRKLAPGHWLEVDASLSLREGCYWEVLPAEELQSDRPDSEWASRFRDLMESAVSLRLRSDVPVGSCLSGGLDSSSIVCLAARHLAAGGGGHRMQTFSACFEDRRFDEREYAAPVIDSTGAEPNLIFPSGEGLRAALERLLAHQGEPFAAPGVYSQWEVFRAARAKRVPVLLDGQGADEQLAGYRKFLYFYLQELWRRRRLGRLAREALFHVTSAEVLRTTSPSSGLRYLGGKLGFLDPGKGLWATAQADPGRTRPDFGLGGGLGGRFRKDLSTFSLPALLRYEDRNSMAHSVESRLPFLDYRVVEFLATVPFAMKIRDGWTKYILRQALKGILPERVRRRKSKLGFSTPEDEWMRVSLKDLALDAFAAPRAISRFVDPGVLMGSFEEFLNGRSRISSTVFFRFLVAELWSRKFLSC
jgi:asparagine synthase (glutamine-hydrolysing)